MPFKENSVVGHINSICRYALGGREVYAGPDMLKRTAKRIVSGFSHQTNKSGLKIW